MSTSQVPLCYKDLLIHEESISPLTFSKSNAAWMLPKDPSDFFPILKTRTVLALCIVVMNALKGYFPFRLEHVTLIINL